MDGEGPVTDLFKPDPTKIFGAFQRPNKSREELIDDPRQDTRPAVAVRRGTLGRSRGPSRGRSLRSGHPLR